MAVVLNVAAIALLALVAGAPPSWVTPPGSTSNRSRGSPETFAFEDVRYTVFRGSIERLRADARQVLLLPMHFGPFEVAGLHQLVVTGAHLEIRLDPGCRPGKPCTDPFLGDPSLGVSTFAAGRISLRHVSTVLLDPVWEVLRNGTVISRFRAEEARIGLGGKKVVLRNFVLDQIPERRRARASDAVWDPDSHAFWIPGDFTLEADGAVHVGQGLLIGVTAL